MDLKRYKDKNDLSFSDLAELFEMEKTKIFRMCNDKKYSVRLVDAMIIQEKTNSVVTLEDLI